jgi:hypothetical protein
MEWLKDRARWWESGRGRALVFAGVFLALFALVAAGVAFAQPADISPPLGTPAADASPGLPTVQDPLPTDPFDGLAAVSAIIGAFRSAWYLGIALVLFLLANVLRGKVKLGDWVVRIPRLSDWFDGVGSKAKGWSILGMISLGGAFAGMAAAPTPWTAVGVASAMFSGLLGGAVLAFAAMGMNDLAKTGQGSEKKIESAVKLADKKGESPEMDEATAAALEKWAAETRAKLAPKG